MVPAGVFDFVQDVDDYYFPWLTGNYFRFLRIANIVVILFATPVYLLFAEGDIPVHDALRFFITDEEFAISIFWQFVLLEIAIDGLKLASLNTPESLGTSLSIIGALLLGEFSVSSGWFVPQTILCMGRGSGKLYTAKHRAGVRDKIRESADVYGSAFSGMGRHGGGLSFFRVRNGCHKNSDRDIISVSSDTMGGRKIKTAHIQNKKMRLFI